MIKFIAPETNVVDMIAAIRDQAHYPVVDFRQQYWLIDITPIGQGIIWYTEFDRMGSPVASYEARFGTYHSIGHIINSPVPKAQLPKLLATSLPDQPETLPISKILAGYR